MTEEQRAAVLHRRQAGHTLRAISTALKLNYSEVRAVIREVQRNSGGEARTTAEMLDDLRIARELRLIARIAKNKARDSPG